MTDVDFVRLNPLRLTMDVDKLQAIGRTHPEVQELLDEWRLTRRENDHTKVALLRMQLGEFDANHTRAQSKLTDRMKVLEDRLDSSAIFGRDLQKRIKELEQSEGDT